jgi:AcrR family transcriptional regulator
MASQRREELLDRAYAYVLEHGIASLSLRPLAAAIGSSPRVLLFLFGSKDGLLRALMGRARAHEMAFLADVDATDLPSLVRATWEWLADPPHHALLPLWLECYSRSLTEPDGPMSGFASDSVRDWLALFARTGASDAACTRALAVLRGAMLDLLATGDADRTTAAVTSAVSRPETA